MVLKTIESLSFVLRVATTNNKGNKASLFIHLVYNGDLKNGAGNMIEMVPGC